MAEMGSQAASSPGGRPRQRPGIRLERHRRRHLLVDRDGRELLVLNESAAALWELCDGQTYPDEMAAAVSEACAVPLEAAVTDVDRALTEFHGAGLIDWVAEGPV